MDGYNLRSPYKLHFRIRIAETYVRREGYTHRQPKRSPSISIVQGNAKLNNGLKMHFMLLAGLYSISIVGPSDSQTPTWPQFGGVGRSVVMENQQIPDSFGPSKNVLWRTPLIPGNSSPCIWGNRIFITGFEGNTLAAFCFERDSGRQIWRVNFDRRGEESFAHPDSAPATPTPCTDGERVIFYFGNYGLIALDVTGAELWRKEFSAESTQFGHGTSPVLHEGSVYLVRDLDTKSALYCIDAETGDERWIVPRPEARANFSTPVVWRGQLIVVGSTVLQAYDLMTGELQWYVGGLTSFVCPSPITSNKILYFGGWSTMNVPPTERLGTGFDEDSGLSEKDLQDVDSFFAKLDLNSDGSLQAREIPRGRAKDTFDAFDFNKNGSWEQAEIAGLLNFPTAPGENILVAIKPGGMGDATDSHVLWKKERGIPYVATPLAYMGRLYYVKKGGLVSCVDAKTGKAHFEAKRLGVGGEYYSTPLGVGSRVVIAAQRGTVFVLNVSNKLEIVARNTFDEKIIASPAVVDNALYLRTSKSLYAIGDDSRN